MLKLNRVMGRGISFLFMPLKSFYTLVGACAVSREAGPILASGCEGFCEQSLPKYFLIIFCTQKYSCFWKGESNLFERATPSLLLPPPRSAAEEKLLPKKGKRLDDACLVV